MNNILLQEMLHQFFNEDIGERDLTSEALFTEEERGSGTFLAKEAGVFVGSKIIKMAFETLDLETEVTLLKKDGDRLERGDVIGTVNGKMRTLLGAERVTLNLVQRLSGIASLTSEAVATLNSEVTKICDTRKTTPGLRMLEKYAVTCGGGYNHRFGLYDGIMIKDNHIEFTGSITEAIKRVRASIGHMVKVEVETESLKQVQEAVEAGADVIMFDNRNPEEIKTFIQHVPNHIVTEASGGITLSNLAGYGDTGVNYISLGFLTHSVKALDISFNVGTKGV
ncbi:carboxylating nicotinate-nucleotide diphosphorylase [Sutcliffiella rhizosphaerae]|uniref:nicotinate-nucleotide diphosphorylase (carboxylating) n=1 Tax=Sutcliffiella rhizosphaerae TaxID=2880967 RepID=A0ABM8YHV5_9BACI|nr:carboxylating nicotinate-nucleotide diphosphorylase [Sutcliffiella rhizosphaerae]CAG9619480.1 putative nicotinate-nucleotide pyrophosphorylase [carboxylating] [Sutcliffiella rhizosphaerae]